MSSSQSTPRHSVETGGPGGDLESDRESMKDMDISDRKKLNSGIDSSVVATVMSVASAKANSKFNSRHKANYDYSPLPDPTEFYFDEEGTRHVTQLDKAGKVALGTTSSDPDNSMFVMPDDDATSRETRIKRFEDAAKSRIRPTDGDLEMGPVLLEDEEIVVQLDCTDIIGIPSTTDDVVYRGDITVSLIKSKEGGSRIFFTVAECSYMSSYKERFDEYEKAVSCVCCFVPFDMGSNKAASSARMEYKSTKLYNSQFFTLPLRPCIVDSSCFRSSVNDFQATSTGANSGVDAKEAQGCCGEGGCCKACGDCPLPLCCGMTSVEGERHAYFALREYFLMGQQSATLDHVVEMPTEEVDGTRWSISAANDDNIYVVMHYRSLIDNSNHECKMRLAKGDPPNVSFQKARKFVSHLGWDRNNDRWDYFHNRPASSFPFFDTGDNELVANSHLGRAQVAAGAASAGVCGALMARLCSSAMLKGKCPGLYSVFNMLPRTCCRCRMR
jgi:hypothetical protein